MEADGDYYLRRARQERAAAQFAIDPMAQCVHFELAMRYAQLADAADGGIQDGRWANPATHPGYIKVWLDW